MVDTSGLRDQVAKILSETLKIDVQDPETDMIEAGLLDSLMFVDLLLHLERTFNIAFTLETLDLDHFHSIRTIVEYIGPMAAGSVVGAPATGPIEPSGLTHEAMRQPAV